MRSQQPVQRTRLITVELNGSITERQVDEEVRAVVPLVGADCHQHRIVVAVLGLSPSLAGPVDTTVDDCVLVLLVSGLLLHVLLSETLFFTASMLEL